MKQKSIQSIQLIIGLMLSIGFVHAQQPKLDKKGNLISMDDVDISSGIQVIPTKNIFSDPNYNIWCGSVIKGKNNKFYMFYSRWPRANGHYAWLPSSEICLAKADKPEGPYKHVKVVLPSRGSQYWDGTTTHNPAAIVYKGKYYLYYMGSTGTNKIKMPASMKDTLWWQYRNNQRIGVAVADNPEGEWERFDKPVI
ncbi:MAG: glycoside hydrolase family protein, partial [Bacteroidota bacterium]|nr:glycoside hydrolase family protein [Bacteroidota bacterium]